MPHLHHYNTTIRWTGNKGDGTRSYSAYSRNHTVSVNGKEDINCSSDPSFRGDPARYNPEELLLASLSSCHMLWYLHLCSVNGVVVVEYADEAAGKMQENADGSGEFTEVVLNPVVKVAAAAMTEKAMALHHDANKYCFIARSVKFPVLHQPVIEIVSNA